MRIILTALVAPVLLAGCKNVSGSYPSLQPRAAEGIDPRLPVAPLSAPTATSAEVIARLNELVRQARSGDAAFRPLMTAAERAAGSAGGAQSESWILAQQALSAAMAARGPTTRAMGDVDELAARELERSGTLSPADLLAVQQAAAAISAIARDQQVRIEAVARRLGA
jgi:hypothetical protein